MILDRVTLTGADNSVSPEDVIALSAGFPFVEWGILVSASNLGTERFPSLPWIARLCSVLESQSAMISVHVCGQWVRDICAGNWTPLFTNVGPLLNFASRVQLNFHCYEHLLSDSFVEKAVERQHQQGWQTIFQVDGVNDHLVSNAYDDGLDCVPLYDKSGGAGITPDTWPVPMKGIYSGYAGGIGPENVAAEIERVRTACADGDRVWIDMETKLYTGGKFDLTKCQRVLDVASEFVTASPVV